MNKTYRIFFATCGGLLIGLAAVLQSAVAGEPINKSTSKINPCPSIFYEKPHYYQVLVPPGCQPNDFTRRMIQQGKLPIGWGIGGERGITQAPAAQPPIYKSVSKVNPCPGIFYEEPHDNQVLVPPRCPLNSFTRMMLDD